MKKVFLVGLVLSSVLTCHAQKFSAPVGEWNESEVREALNMKSYDADPGTEAVALFRGVRVEMGAYGTKVTYLERIKLFTSAAYDAWSDGSITVRSDGVTTLKGHSYNLVGDQVIKRAIGETDIRKQKLNRVWDSYTISIPNVREGSVVEFSYTTMLNYYWLPSWRFQLSIPCLYSEVYLNNFEAGFRADIGGTIQIKYEELKRNLIHRWSVANIPAFKPEPQMPHPDLFISSLNLWRYEKPWDENRDLIAWKKAFFALPAGQTSTLRDKLDEILVNTPDDRSKIKAIVAFVKNNVEWNEYEDFQADDFNDILKKKKGTAGDINLMLIALLSRADINANPVLLSTRDNGHLHQDIPTLYQFNYVVAQAVLGKDTLYLDATERHLQYDALPPRCFNSQGLLVTKSLTKWVYIEPRHKKKLTAEGNFTISPDGELVGKLQFTRDGYESYVARKAYSSAPDDYVKQVTKASWRIEGKSIQNELANDLPLVETYDVAIGDNINMADSRMYLNPWIVPYITENPFNSDTRNFPIEFDTPIEATLLCNITLPEGYVVEELPQSKVMALPGNAVRAIFNISGTPKQIQVMTRLQINRTFFLPEEHEQLKEFYARILAKQGEQIVLLSSK